MAEAVSISSWTFTEVVSELGGEEEEKRVEEEKGVGPEWHSVKKYFDAIPKL